MKQHVNRRKICLAMVAAFSATFTSQAFANETNWPTKPIKLVVGYAAGGATDVVARLVAARMGTELGQSLIVDNRAGANSNVGAEVVARSPADGYTLYVFTIANTINASLYSKLSYDPAKDFEPIGLIAKIPNLLVVNPSLPVQSVQEYIKYTKESKDGITFASSGSGSSIHLSGEMFKMKTGLNMLHVPYRGSAPAVSDLLGGQVQSMFDNSPSAMPHVQAGKLRALAITSKERSHLLPDVPTVAESGFPGFEVQSWFGMSAPKGTPSQAINRLNAALNAALEDPAIKQRLMDMVATTSPGTPGDMQKFVNDELKNWNEVVKASGAKAD